MVRGCVVWITLAAAAMAQEGATVPSGVPLRVALERRVRVKRVGEPIRGRLVEPVYVFDRMALPSGSLLEGRIAEIGGVTIRRRLQAILSGNLTPPRDARAQFDTLLLSDGSRLPLATSLSHGTDHLESIVPPRKKQSALRTFTGPGKMSRLKARLFSMLPYHRQSWNAGTLFTGVLQQPLVAPPLPPAEASTPPPSEPQELHARLLVPVTSATARRGDTVEAVVTRPVFSSANVLLIPEGSRVLGDVVEARPARRLHRNGKLHFVFRRIQLPSGAVQPIQGYLEGVDADFNSHLALDSEGATRARSPKTRFIFPAIAVAVGALSLHQDIDSHGVPDQDYASRAESGAVGLGLIGTVLAQTSRTVASTIAFTGAGFSVYSTFLARGQDVLMPAHTTVRVNLRERGAR